MLRVVSRKIQQSHPESPRIRGLLALDLDGTLLRKDGSIDPRDQEAIARVQSAGVAVTIATGRLWPGAEATAKALRLDAPLICADGRLICDGESGAVIDEHPIAPAELTRVLALLREHALCAFILRADGIECEEAGRAHLTYLTGWSPTHRVSLRLRPDVRTLLALGLGPESAVNTACAMLADVDVEVASFPMGDLWAVRVQAPDVSKGTALSTLASRLGVTKEDVAAVGDWFNDVPMLAWAGRSFAMAGAPPAVREAAKEMLGSRAGEGGGVAEAIERWHQS